MKTFISSVVLGILISLSLYAGVNQVNKLASYSAVERLGYSPKNAETEFLRVAEGYKEAFLWESSQALVRKGYSASVAKRVSNQVWEIHLKWADDNLGHTQAIIVLMLEMHQVKFGQREALTPSSVSNFEGAMASWLRCLKKELPRLLE